MRRDLRTSDSKEIQRGELVVEAGDRARTDEVEAARKN